MQVENSPTTYNVYVTTPDTVREADCQRASLSLQQLVAVAPLVTEEAHQGVLRDYLLYGLRQQMQHRRSLKSDAKWIHERLADPGRGRHAEVLRTVNSLSRGGAAISADRIERILSRIEKSVA